VLSCDSIWECVLSCDKIWAMYLVLAKAWTVCVDVGFVMRLVLYYIIDIPLGQGLGQDSISIQMWRDIGQFDFSGCGRIGILNPFRYDTISDSESI
jgi:hypothetical protein